ncbi:hypothetical protein [Leptospirillum ferrooxidans]|jgi:hypothetical protein|uniref:Uncharacterized protein n=1 Tax=Leptospirillum ferrooxidans (strain C2-3) TaxID=1162668 RepID=I0IPP3_LEPFC|nr:hypothetical protein [Leptospirillum ferrooxidans]BAM07242.1 hypothetical protein LFE_1560 [Leptospirillum ferrooxidans C2-3]
MSDSHDHSHDTSDEDLNELINSLSQVIDKGTPEVVLENVEDDDVVSEALATLYEMDSLGVISSLPSITPDWSLAIRRFLETYSEGVEVEDDLVQIGGTSENSRFMYGFGIMIDGLERPDLSLSPDTLEKIQEKLSSVFQLRSKSMLYLHPTLALLPELYLFSFEERREFFLEVPESQTLLPDGLGSVSEEGSFLSAPVETILGEEHPVVRYLGSSQELHEGESGYPVFLMGSVISQNSPMEGGIQEFLEGDDTGLFDAILSEIGEMLDPENENADDLPSVSILPWSLLFPMGVSLHFQQRVMEFVYRMNLSGKETLEMVPFWENGFLWIHASLKGKNEGHDFLVVDEYVLEFLEELIEPVLTESLPVRLKWHPLPKDGRGLSLGLV